jgi:hypothetical protein
VRDALGEERYLALCHEGRGYALADIVQFAAEVSTSSRRTPAICRCQDRHRLSRLPPG